MLDSENEKKILVITPALESEEFAFFPKEVARFGRKGLVSVHHSFIDTGTGSIENYVDDALVTPGTLVKAIQAEAEGFDGIVINCMCDPGVHAVREAVTIPVSGTAEIAMHTAAILGHRFGFIDVLDSSRGMVLDQVARYGLASRFGCFRAINVPVLDIEKDKEGTINKLVEEAVAAVVEDHADVIILGCGAFLGCDVAIRKAFGERFAKLLSDSGAKRGLSPVPVIDPLPLAINTMIGIVLSGLSTSKIAYPFPRNPKHLKSYELPLSCYASKL